MGYKKKSMTIAVSLILALIMLAGCGVGKTGDMSDETGVISETEDMLYELDMFMLTFGTTPTDMEVVVDEINKISEAEIGVRVSITPISFGDYSTQVNLVLSSNEKLDLLPVMVDGFSSYVAKGQLLPIDEELAAYGQGIVEAIGIDYIKAGKVAGEQYGITTNRDLATNYGIMMRADLAEKYGVDYDRIDSLADFEKVLAAVKEGEKDIIPLVPGMEKVEWYGYYGGFDGLGDTLGILMNSGDTLEVKNLFADEEYSDFIHLIREWFIKGYILEDASTASEVGPNLVKAGRAFAYISRGKPGYVTQEQGMTGYDMKFVEFRKADTSTTTVQTLQWCVPRNCQNTEKTVEFLNLMYTNADIQNLLSWGIEGKHYVISDDGHATYPEGIDATNTGYGLSMGWQMGNQFLTYVWEGDEIDLWAQMDDFNKSATISSAMGYTWDSSNVKTEVAACTNVLDQYRISLECGMVDPDEILPEFLEALQDAGIEKIIMEKQNQLDSWATK